MLAPDPETCPNAASSRFHPSGTFSALGWNLEPRIMGHFGHLSFVGIGVGHFGLRFTPGCSDVSGAFLDLDFER